MSTRKNLSRPGAQRLAPAVISRADSAEPPPRLTPAIEAELGKTMRAMYDNLLDQPIPDRFVELLRRLDEGRETSS